MKLSSDGCLGLSFRLDSFIFWVDQCSCYGIFEACFIPRGDVIEAEIVRVIIKASKGQPVVEY